MPYKERFHLIITYEVDSSMYQIERIETTIINWLGEIGGFWAIFAVSLALVD